MFNVSNKPSIVMSTEEARRIADALTVAADAGDKMRSDTMNAIALLGDGISEVKRGLDELRRLVG